VKRMMSGNEAIARGAYEYGVRVAAAYPGTPSTEILEYLSAYPGIYSEWAPNEKAAYDVAMGASFSGVRALAAMKHVGVNVASDALATHAYLGVNGGFLLINADDPGAFSSSNEQDNRHYARFFYLPVLEPSDSQEAKDFIGIGLKISEEFDLPVMIRTTTRVAHSKGIVALGRRQRIKKKPFKNFRAVGPPGQLVRHERVLNRLKELETYAEEASINRTEWGDRHIGIITSGFSYQVTKEVIPSASFLKLGITHPLPKGLIRQFASGVHRLFIVEELEPFLEEQIRAIGLSVEGKGLVTNRVGELSRDFVEHGFARALTRVDSDLPEEKATSHWEGKEDLPPRVPTMCPGCPHRGAFYVLKKLDLIATGDVGCNTFGAVPPWLAMQSIVCMGSSIGNALGIEKGQRMVLAETDVKPCVAVIGDSTFLHAGIPGLIDVVYNKGWVTLLLLDNMATGMTGLQDHPGTGRTLMKEATKALDYGELCRAIGVKRICTVDAYNLEEIEETLRAEIQAREPSVIIVRRPCTLLHEFKRQLPFSVDKEKCTGCNLCTKLMCSAILLDEAAPLQGRKKGFKVVVDPASCTGCSICAQVCPTGAIQAIPREQ
jgi:indolepyruvate ferredoxin oxidoreductase alpha subunit